MGAILHRYATDADNCRLAFMKLNFWKAYAK